MIWDRFTGSNEPADADDAETVYSDDGVRWDIVIGDDGHASVDQNGENLFRATGGAVLAWDQLVDQHGPLSAQPPQDEVDAFGGAGW